MSLSDLIVAAAIIERRGHFLLCKRLPTLENGGLWEFPGGKLQIGESLQQCLERELTEELGVKSKAGKIIASSEVVLNIKSEKARKLKLFGLQTVIEREPRFLKDHSEFRWVRSDEWETLPMTASELALIRDLERTINIDQKVSRE